MPAYIANADPQSSEGTPNVHFLLPWLIWGLGAAYFFCDYFARVSPGVMVPELMQAFGVSALGLGSLSAFFYYPYLAMQIPVGLLVDRLGVRLILFSMALLTGFGCYLFGAAHVLWVAQLGRFLIGFGAAFAFVSALKLATVWFPTKRFGLLAGLTQALGMLGAAVGQAPVAMMVAWVGWRYTMSVMALIFVILASLILVIIRDHPVQSMTPKTSSDDRVSVLQSLWLVMRNHASWTNAIYAGLLFAPTAAFAELWGVSYLTNVQHLSHTSAAAANGMIFLGWGVGGPLLGWLSDRLQRRKPVMILSAATGLILMSIIILSANLSPVVVYTLLFLFGISNAGVATAYAVASEINPRNICGASMAFANMMSVVVGAFLQPVIGYVLDYLAEGRIQGNLPHYLPQDYQTAMLFLPCCLFLCIVITYWIPETHCKPIREIDHSHL